MACLHPPNPICDIIGHESVLKKLEQAKTQNRMPHAVLLSGPSGIGKARLALETAERILKNHESLRAGSHPDFRWICRGESEKTEIAVDSVRELISFMAHKAGRDSYKIAVIDAIDDLNRFGLNAVLKTLEEPQGRALLLLIHHGRRAIPRTIISRCMQLRLSPLSENQTLNVLSYAGIEMNEQSKKALKLAPGRPGLILHMMEKSAQEAHNLSLRALQEASALSAKTLADLNTIATRSPEALNAILRTLCQHTQQAACATSHPQIAGIWAKAYMRLAKLSSQQQELMLDPGQNIAAMLRELAQARRHTQTLKQEKSGT